MKCELCKKEIEGKGHMLSRGGECCDNCNWLIVIPARMKGVHL